MRSLHSIRLLILVALVAGTAVHATAADQQAAKPATPAARPVPTPRKKKQTDATSVKVAKIVASRKSKSTTNAAVAR